MEESEFIHEYMGLTGCTEAEARNTYIYVAAQQAGGSFFSLPDNSYDSVTINQDHNAQFLTG